MAADDATLVMSEVLMLTAGASAAGDATLSITGGDIAEVAARGKSTVSIVNGKIGALRGEDDGMVTLSGTQVRGNVLAVDNSNITMIGGSVGVQATALGKSTVSVLNGRVRFLAAAENGQATITAGEVETNIIATEDSHITMNGGTVAGGIGARNHGAVSLIGGLVRGVDTNGEPLGLFATDFGTVDVDGTVIENGAQADEVAELNLRSGRIVGSLVLQGGSSVELSNSFQITEDLQAGNNATVVMNGGRIGSAAIAGGTLLASGDSQVTVNNGQMVSLHALGNAKVAFNGGNVEFGVSASDNSAVSINGGTVKNSIFGHDGANVTITGGKIEFHGFGSQVNMNGHSHLSIGGGTVDTGVEAHDSARITISGGEIAGGIVLRNDVRDGTRAMSSLSAAKSATTSRLTSLPASRSTAASSLKTSSATTTRWSS